MKKIYKSLTVVACVLMANAAYGQNLVVTADGAPIKDGAVIELPYEFEDYSFPEMNIYEYNYIWDPQLAAATVSGTANLTVTVTSVGDTDGFQMCWPGNCFFVPQGGSAVSSGVITTEPSMLMIDKMVVTKDADELPTGGTVKVKLVCGAETMEITVNAILADKNGVSENFADSNAPTVYYSLEGIRVENPAKGIYVMRKGGQAKLVRK